MASGIQKLITKKKHGLTLSSEDLELFVQLACTNQAHDSQIGALLMAIAINGLSMEESAALTGAMIKSGKQMNWSGLAADKHSTGGVGDKVSIPLVPILAELGLVIPMISGRSLEFTGGTLDKLESIPGFNVNLSLEEMRKCISNCGCFIAATTEDLCPGDRALYRIRDVTCTIDCTPLVTASILSKKIAEGAKYLVQDIKVGDAAFYKDVESASELAKHMIRTANLYGLKMSAMLTRMDFPLGRAVGNSLEILECLDILKGKHFPEDLMELILELGGKLLQLTGRFHDTEEAKEEMKATIKNGKALERFAKMLKNQGVREEIVNLICFENAVTVLPKAKYSTKFKVSEEGYIVKINALSIAKICFDLGNGRKIPTDVIDPAVGCEILVSQGEHVEAGKYWAVLYHNSPLNPDIHLKMDAALTLSKNQVQREKILIETLNSEDC